MNILSKILFLFILFTGVSSASVYRDTYEVQIQREIFQIQGEIDRDSASPFEIKRKEYLEKRLKKLQTVGIARITFSTNVKKREPVDSITEISYTRKRVYLFTEIENMRGRYITHIWYFNDNEVYKKRFKIKGSSWRVWTSKRITKSMVGSWKGIIIDDNDNVLVTKHFTVTK